jgi:hypothetical protein
MTDERKTLWFAVVIVAAVIITAVVVFQKIRQSLNADERLPPVEIARITEQEVARNGGAGVAGVFSLPLAARLIHRKFSFLGLFLWAPGYWPLSIP